MGVGGAWKNGTKFLLDLLFPIFCLGCRAEGRWVCEACTKTLPAYAPYICLKCGTITEKSMLCRVCFFDSAIDGVFCATSYEDGLAQRMVQQLKYEGVDALAQPIAEVMGVVRIIDRDYCVIPIPLHAKRYMQRGYNQAAVIAYAFADKNGYAYADALCRNRATRSQVGLHRDERQKNMHGVFSMRKNSDVRGRSILLIDDVFTTGSTVASAARVLKDAGAREVMVFTFAHG